MIEQAVLPAGLPIVSEQVRIQACADLLRPMIESEDANPLFDELERLNAENPELVRAIVWFAEDGMDIHHALMVLCFAIKVLRAQAEVDQLKSLKTRRLQ